MKTFFASDTHFQHVNIITYCNRPWANIEEMTEGIIKNWNEVVSPEDTVYHIGDFAMGKKDLIPWIRARLNGNIHLILGNHDYNHKHTMILKQIEAGGFASIQEELFVEVDDVKLWLRHEPKMEFVPSDEAMYHICGHVHDAFTRVGSIINAGLDVCNYRPVSLSFLLDQPESYGKPHRGYGKDHPPTQKY